MTRHRREEDIINDVVKLSVKVALIFRPEVPADFDEIDIGRRQLQILFSLGQNGPSRAQVLASGLCVSASTLSKMVTPLVKRGFIARDEDPNDRRAVNYSLLDKGSRLIRGGWEADRALGKEVLNRLTPQHISNIHEFLKEFLTVGNTIEVEMDCGDSDPQQQRQSNDVIEKIMCLWDKSFLNVGTILPYELYDLGVTISDIRVLQYLHQNGSIRMGSIARWMNVGQPTATGVVNRLVERGLVARVRDHGDWRVVLCRLTDEGQRLMDSQLNPSIINLRSRLEMINNRQMQNIVRAFRALLRAYKAIGENSQPNQE
ncbi:MarR family winged helix-turn-helix transcriptional regulator [Chloroflexota bacterium]